MNHFRLQNVLGLAVFPFLYLPCASAMQQDINRQASGTTSHFQIAEKTQIPGRTLKPGGYSIVLVDRLADRMVLHITSDAGKDEATFLAVAPTTAFPASTGNGPVAMHAKGNESALRGFIFGDGTRTEFVYQKQEAATLAKVNGTTLVAIDPASEGRPVKDNLSPTDRQVVSLWMLTPTVVGKTPAMEARRYQAASGTLAAAPAARDISERTAPVLTARNDAPAPHRVAHPIAVLPHTASEQPSILLASMVSLLAAAGLMLRRRSLASSH